MAAAPPSDVVDAANTIAPVLRNADPDLSARELQLHLKLQEIYERMATNEADRQAAWETFNQLVPEFVKNWKETERRAKIVPIPPSAHSAANVETLMMAQGFTLEPMTHLTNYGERESDAREVCLQMAAHLADKVPALSKMRRLLDGAFSPNTDETIVWAHAFAIDWLRSGFAKLEIGHKLAASLALTDVPDDIEIKAPWKAWSLIVPPGIFHDPNDPGAGVLGLARVWCEGTEPRFFVSHDGTIMGPIKREMIYRQSNEPRGRAVAIAIDCLVRGACLALANPDDYRKSRVGASHSKTRRSSDAPDFSATRFMLSAPVSVDLREHLAETISGKARSGGSPKVQFLVRGHWRNQAHGAQRALRKQIWIQPFWKGDEETRVLLRNYTVKS